MNKEEFLKAVRVELDYLRNNLSKDQKKLLVFSRFDHDTIWHCIYGLIFGGYACIDAKAFYSKTFESIITSNYRMKTMTRTKYSFSEQSYELGDSYTYLEKYLYMCSKETHRQIFRYIKNKIDKIDIQ